MQNIFAKHRCFCFLLPLLIFGLAGCSSTGYSAKTDLVVPTTIRAPKTIPPEVVPYLPRFVDMLHKEGFSVGETEDPDALDLVLEFNGNPFNLRVSAGLWREGVPILTASSTNSGWGTALARGSAVNSLAESAATTFHSELTNLMARTKIVPDAVEIATQLSATPDDKHTRPSPVDEHDKYADLERLKKLLDDGALTQEEYDSEKAKILGK